MPFFSCLVKEEINNSLRVELCCTKRLDCYVSENLRLLSRSQIKARQLKAKVNGKEVKLSRHLKQGDFLELTWDDELPLDIIPQDIPLEIVYEDVRCIVVNKAQGMVVHPGAGNRQGTLANALLFIREQRTIDKKLPANDDDRLTQTGRNRPGIVHRLDKDTSGLIIASWDDEAHAFLAEQFKTRRVKKNYVALVSGVPKDQKGCIETYIARDTKNRKRFTVSANGKPAITYYKVIKQWKNYSLLLLRPKTGRTHQLRVHLRYIGCPILGDPVYSQPACKAGFQCTHADKRFPDATLMLHSKRLAITLPGETSERVFTSAMPERFVKIIEELDRNVKSGFATEFPAHG